MVDIHTYPDQQSACAAAKDAVEQALKTAAGKPILFLVSGGSGFDVLNQLSESIFDLRLPAQTGFTVCVIDERFSTDPIVNNFLQFQNTDFYKKATAKAVSFIPTIPKEGELIEEMAKRFEGQLRTWAAAHPDGVMIALLGIGKDGHTAGMIGNPDDKRSFQFMFEDDSTWVAGYDAGTRNQYPLRVTTTMPFLKKLDTVIVYAVGESKKNALSAILAPTGDLYKTPGRIICELQHCLLYTDQAVDTVKT
jgi:6-phosphogluconolactonase/glucosamine-6-phosphate isomerase/deaminase